MPKLRPRSDKPLKTSRIGVGFVAFVCSIGALLWPSSASATLLEEPPKLFTFKLDDPSAPQLGLLRAFHNAEIERPGSLRRYSAGPFGRWREAPFWQLAWKPFASAMQAEAEAEHEAVVTFPREPEAVFWFAPQAENSARLAALLGFAPRASSTRLEMEPDVVPAWSALDPSRPSLLLSSTGPSLLSNGFDSLWAPPAKPVRDWRCRRRAVILVRQSGERDVFPLVRCDGSVAPDALDKLSLMMRPPEVSRPGELLPDEPDPEATLRGEWIADVRLANPRLLWVLQRIADAFPWRPIYIYSGYRPGAHVAGTSHHSMHAAARAVDIQVHGIPNATVWQLCRQLEDAGCGFYPNSKFVHVDVRKPGTGHAIWIDASGPSEPPRYVDSWPGVLDSGGMVWAPHPSMPGDVSWSARVPTGSSNLASPRYGGPP